jgi:MoaA/NifB/PqqE/SkfB family radical SAM enzyme
MNIVNDTLQANASSAPGSDFVFPPYLEEMPLVLRTSDELRELVGGRKIYLRGAAFVGQGIAAGLKRNGFNIEGYLDSSPRLQGKILHGKPVFKPEDILSRNGVQDDIFIIMTSGRWAELFARELSQYGLKENTNYISSYDLVPFNPSIDISGACNLKCIGCPRGNMRQHPPVGFMGPETYTLVIDKFLREIPLLGAVQLYTWGEPLLNKHVHDIIAINKERMVRSIISTNLSLPTDIEKLVRSAPEIVRVSCSGWEGNYEITHTGGNWGLFYSNLNKLAELNSKHQADIDIELFFHRYAHNSEDYKKVEELCGQLGVTFRPAFASLYPRENHVKLRMGQELTPEARKQLSLITPFAKQFIDGTLRKEPDNKCPELQCFSVNWNLSVRVCGVTYLPTVADNFLETPLPELIKLVALSDTCKMCEKSGANLSCKIMMADAHITEN